MFIKKKVVKVCPKDRDAKLKFNECQKICNRIAFERAIAVDDSKFKKSAFDEIDINQQRESKVPDDYTGPKIKDNSIIDIEFVTNLIEYFRNQKVLHKKYVYEILFQIRDLFSKQPSLVDITVPDESKFTICGDIHGQFYVNIQKIHFKRKQFL
jgi:serine/threonine-protein phosphatase 5